MRMQWHTSLPCCHLTEQIWLYKYSICISTVLTAVCVHELEFYLYFTWNICWGKRLMLESCSNCSIGYCFGWFAVRVLHCYNMWAEDNRTSLPCSCKARANQGPWRKEENSASWIDFFLLMAYCLLLCPHWTCIK